jgi:ATP-dependent protease ClpP protease subunit
MMKKISLNGIIGLDVRSSDIIKQIEDAGSEDKVFEIHSPGGSVMEGLAIYNAIKQSEGKSTMRVLGLAASMASIIAMSKGKPEVAKRSIFMIHNAQMYAQGDYQVLQKAADLSNKISDMMASIYAENSKKSKRSIREMMDKETYMFGEQIQSEGFAKTVYDDGKTEKESDAVAMAQLEMEECNKKMCGYKEDFAMAAQLINELNPVMNPVENKSKEDIKMKLDELLKANPEAKAEYDSILESAKGEGKAELAKAVAIVGEDRKRIAKILQVAKAELQPETIAAIESDMQPGDFAIEMIANQKALGDKAAEKDSPFKALVSKQTPKDQTKNAIEDMKAELNEVDKKIEAAVKNSIPKRGVK